MLSMLALKRYFERSFCAIHSTCALLTKLKLIFNMSGWHLSFHISNECDYEFEESSITASYTSIAYYTYVDMALSEWRHPLWRLAVHSSSFVSDFQGKVPAVTASVLKANCFPKLLLVYFIFTKITLIILYNICVEPSERFSFPTSSYA